MLVLHYLCSVIIILKQIIDDMDELSEMSFSEGYELAEKEFSKIPTAPPD